MLPMMMTPIDVWSIYIELKVHYKDNQEPFQQFFNLSSILQRVAGVTLPNFLIYATNSHNDQPWSTFLG